MLFGGARRAGRPGHRRRRLLAGVLDDPRRAFPPYDAVLLLSRAAAARPALVAALAPLVASIDDTAMRRANRRVDVEGLSIGEAAGALDAAR